MDSFLRFDLTLLNSPILSVTQPEMGVVGYHRERTPQGWGDTCVYYNEDSLQKRSTASLTGTSSRRRSQDYSRIKKEREEMKVKVRPMEASDWISGFLFFLL